MNEERLVDIEIKLAHQEQALNELNEVITSQAGQIDRLERLCSTLAERMKTLGDEMKTGNPPDEKPPHY